MIFYTDSILEKTKIKPRTILEIGSRDAIDAIFLSNFFKISHKNVYVVEPNPTQYKIICNDYKNVNAFNCAIFNKEGVLDFNRIEGEDSGVSSLLDRYDNYYENKSNIIKVETITGESLLCLIDKEIDLCKIDVEGATYEVLESFKEKIHLIKSFHIECEHISIWKNQKLYNDVKRFLENKDYIQIYFQYVNNIPQQSDSVWVQKNYLK